MPSPAISANCATSCYRISFLAGETADLSHLPEGHPARHLAPSHAKAQASGPDSRPRVSLAEAKRAASDEAERQTAWSAACRKSGARWPS